MLDWYEEGTFTPVLFGTTTAGVGTYTFQLGRFTRIGNRVFLDITLVCTAHTGTGNMQISGLPFIANSSQMCALAVRWESAVIGSGKQLGANVIAGGSQVVLRACDPAGGSSLPIEMDATTTFYISGAYSV